MAKNQAVKCLNFEAIEFGRVIIVFDLGGTYFRSALYTQKEGLKEISKQPALNFCNASQGITVQELKQKLISYLVLTARYYAKKAAADHIYVSISLGAALNNNTGIVYGSGPLWGNDNTKFNLLNVLNKAASEFTWYLVNDVTAAITHYASYPEMTKVRKILLLTISTGIACRIFDTRNQCIALDEFGLQGEIGHLPVTLIFNGKPLELICDCGVHNHLSSFSSGRGLMRLMSFLAEQQSTLWKTSKLAQLQKKGLNQEDVLKKALAEKDEFALKILYLATQNVAAILRNALAMDPEIDHIILTGGVIINLSGYYREMLLRHFSEHGLYLTSDFDPMYFERKIILDDGFKVNNLIGAALYATSRGRRYNA